MFNIKFVCQTMKKIEYKKNKQISFLKQKINKFQNVNNNTWIKHK